MDWNKGVETVKTEIKRICIFALALCLFACGGGGGGGSSSPPVNNGGGSSSIPTWTPGFFETSASFKSLCESPRSGSSQQTGEPFPDIAGSTLLENHWLRSWTDETYLWYDEVPEYNPASYTTSAYFDLLKTNATTASGADKDQFHFTYSTEEYEQLSQSGVSAGYGFQVTFLSREIPYELAIAYTEPNTPAADAGISRGARILFIDGADAQIPTSQADVDLLNDGLSPANIGETHTFVIQDLGSNSQRTLNLTSEEITATPVQNVQSIDTATGKVGYILFNDHIATAEGLLIDAVEQLDADDVQDLVLDLRYNGGGFLYIASQLAYMIAGDGATNGQVFEQLLYNDKIAPEAPIPFVDETIGFSEPVGQDLPSLDLGRVFILSSGGTCSASESIINGLRGVGVEVILIGDTTCGKPYGFLPEDNCGTTYFTIQFQSENALGFSDYADGFTPQEVTSLGAVSVPGCAAADDFDNVLGDPNENMLATALNYRATGSCSAVAGMSPDNFAPQKPIPLATPPLTPKPEWLQNRNLGLPNE